jgi:hypothetical protein
MISPEKVLLEEIKVEEEIKLQEIVSKISEVESKKESSLSNFSDDVALGTDEKIPQPKMQDSSKILSLIGKQSQMDYHNEANHLENVSTSKILQILDKPDIKDPELVEQKEIVNKSYQLIQRLQDHLASSLSNHRVRSSMQ